MIPNPRSSGSVFRASGFWGVRQLGHRIYSPPQVDRVWLWVYSNKISIYPIFYLLKGDYRVPGLALILSARPGKDDCPFTRACAATKLLRCSTALTCRPKRTSHSKVAKARAAMEMIPIWSQFICRCLALAALQRSRVALSRSNLDETAVFARWLMGTACADCSDLTTNGVV